MIPTDIELPASARSSIAVTIELLDGLARDMKTSDLSPEAAVTTSDALTVQLRDSGLDAVQVLFVRSLLGIYTGVVEDHDADPLRVWEQYREVLCEMGGIRK